MRATNPTTDQPPAAITATAAASGSPTAAVSVIAISAYSRGPAGGSGLDWRAVALDTKAKGKTYPPHVYEVGAEKIREYAEAVGEDNPVYFDRDKAKEAGFRDIPAPPMFAVVYSAGSVGPAVLDPEVGINFTMMVHGGQEFVWGEPVCAGDTITTETRVKDIYEDGGKGFYVFESVSTNQDGQEVVRGTWTNIVRGVSE